MPCMARYCGRPQRPARRQPLPCRTIWRSRRRLAGASAASRLERRRAGNVGQRDGHRMQIRELGDQPQFAADGSDVAAER